MSRRVLLVGAVLAVAVAVVVGLVWRPWASDVPDDAAFVVGDQAVSVSELDRHNESLRALYGVQEPSAESEQADFRRQSAKSMAIGIVLDHAADDASVDVPEEEVDRALAVFVDTEFGGDREEFLDALGNVGTSEDDVRAEIRRQLRLRQLLDEVDGEVEVADDEVVAAFEERKDTLATPERRRMRNIVVATRADAARVRQQLDAGADVTRLARQVSMDAATRTKGGDLGAVSRDDLVPAVGRAVFGAGPGAAYGPVQGPQGWNVGVVTEVLPRIPATLARVGDELRATLEAEESQRRWTAWLEDQLRGAGIEYADGYRPEDPYEVSAWTGPEPR